MSTPTAPDDETFQWFDEEFAGRVKPREPDPLSVEKHLDRQEHQALVASFRRKLRTGEH